MADYDIEYHRGVEEERTKALAAAVLFDSIRAGRRGDPQEIAWLASTSAQKWLDLLNIPQSTMLKKIGWMDWARKVIEGRRGDPSQRVVIAQSLHYMEDLLS